MIDLLKGYNNANDIFGGLFQSVLVSLLTGIVIQIYKSIKSFVSKIREKQKRINIREMSAVDYDIVKKISDNSTWQAIEYCGICFIKYVIDICWIVVFIESIDKIYCLYGMGLSVKDNDRASVIIGVLCFTCCLYAIGARIIQDRKWSWSGILRQSFFLWLGLLLGITILLWILIYNTILLGITLLGVTILFYILIDTVVVYNGIYEKYQNNCMLMGRIIKYIVVLIGALTFICAHQRLSQKLFIMAFVGVWYVVCVLEYVGNLAQVIRPVEYKIFCKGNVYSTYEGIVCLKDKKIKFMAEDGSVYIIDIEQIKRIEYEISDGHPKYGGSRDVDVVYKNSLDKDHIYDDYRYIGPDWIRFAKKQEKMIRIIILKSKEVERIVSKIYRKG